MTLRGDGDVTTESSVPSGAAVDRTLVERMARGDETAAALLFDRYAGTVYAVALRILGDPAEADEVTLDAFMQVWWDASRYDPSRGSVAAWLIMIGRSRALDGARSRMRRERAVDRSRDHGAPEPAGAWVPDPSLAAEEEERRQRVNAALSALPADQRQTIELAFFEGLSHSEIAARLATPLGTVKTRVRSGMQKLRESLHDLFAQEAL